MASCNCCTRRSCTALAVIASVAVGVIAAFLQFSAVITVTPAFLWVTLGVAIGYLGVTLLSTALARREAATPCCCTAIAAQLFGILGTVLFSIILLAVTFAATSVIGAIFVGVLLFFFALTVTSTACVVKCLAGCDN